MSWGLRVLVSEHVMGTAGVGRVPVDEQEDAGGNGTELILCNRFKLQT